MRTFLDNLASFAQNNTFRPINITFSKALDAVHADSVREISIASNGKVTMPTVYYAEIACPIKVTTKR